MPTHFPDGFERIKISVEHPVMGPAQPRQIVGSIVPAVVVQVGDSQAGLDLKPANDTAAERVGFAGDPVSRSLVSFFHVDIPRPVSKTANGDLPSHIL
jgi:hypothetical protein